MAVEEVRCTRHIDTPPAQIWAHLREFCAPWHPLIATMVAEQGGRVRAFTVKGEDTEYRERLTWFSDTQMMYRYIHLAGIDGVDHYAGCLSVSPSGKGGCTVTLSAEITAEPPRLQEIAEGTTTIFDIGLKSLSGQGDEPQQLAASEDQVRWERQYIGNDPKLAIDVTPQRDGPLCLFLHGIGGNRTNWQGQLGLAGSITRAAALDLRGYGDSRLGAAQTTLEDHCNDIAQVADALGADRLILCGLSFGSWIATAFAEKYPDRLAGLMLAGGCTGMSEAGVAEREAFRTSREVPLDAGKSPADFAPDVINVISGPNVSQEALATMQASMAAIPTATYRDALRCFTNPPGRFDFSRLTMPVLMMTGEFDALATPAEIHSVATRIHTVASKPDVRFEVIAGAGHICNVEASQQFNVPMMEFLRRVAQ